MIGALIVNENAPVLSTRIPSPAIPLIVLPPMVSAPPEPLSVTFCPIPVAIQIPPTDCPAPMSGWFVNVELKIALSPSPGLGELDQFPLVPQAFDTDPFQKRSAA